MSNPILPLAVWASGTNQNSIPANDNALRIEALRREIISLSVTAQPASPVDRDTYIIAATHTGAQWSTFSPKDITMFLSGTWYAWAPTEGLVVNVAGSEYKFDGGVWTAAGGGLANPMTTVGDIITGGTSGAPQRLAASTNGYVLTLASGAPTWSTPGLSNPMTTAADLIVGGVAGAASRLGVGSNGNVLTVTAGAVGWAAPSSGFTNPMTTVGDLIVGGAAGAAGRIAAGTSTYVLTSNGAGVAPTWQAAGGGGGGVTGFTTSLATTSPNNTVNASVLLASGGTTNQDLVIQPKGTGSISAQLPNSATSGGNKRGEYAIDLQLQRASAGQVATGSNSTIGGGTSNQASGIASTVSGGDTNVASGQWSSVVGGTANNASSTSSTIGGGNSNYTSGVNATVGGGLANSAYGYASTVSGGSGNNLSFGNFSTVSGGYQNLVGASYAFIGGGGGNSIDAQNSWIGGGRDGTPRSIECTFAFGSPKFSVLGDNQINISIFGADTTDATATALSAGRQGASTTSVNVLPNNSVYYFEATVVGKKPTFGDRATFKITGQISRGANAAATQIDGTPTVTTIATVGGASAWVVAAVANTTRGSLEINVTGVAATTIKWTGRIDTMQLAG